MSYSLEQALAELASLRANNAVSETALFNLANQVSVDATGAVTVLYSGKMPDGISSAQAVQALLNAGQNVRVVDKTAAAAFLQSREFKASFAQVSGMSPEQLDDPNYAHAAKDRLFHATDGPWASASRRFAEATTGAVRVIAHNADPNRILAATELPALLDNGAITSVEGIPLSELRAVRNDSGIGEVFKRVRLISEWNIAASGTTSSAPLLFLDSALFDQQAYLENHPDAHSRLDDYYRGRQTNAVSAADMIDRRATSEAMRRVGEGSHLSGASRVLNRLGMVGAVVGFGLAASDANAAHSAGDTQRAKDIMKEWAVDAAGSEIGSIIGTAVGGIALAAAVAAGVTIGAPLAGALLLGGALIGGIFGAEGATELYRLYDDRDANGRRDIMDRLSNLLFGATSTLTTPLPADLNGARLTIDASITQEDLIANARSSAAWRYALRELNSFVITDVDYQRHNIQGSLDLYDEATGQGSMTERYIADRAAMLTWKLQFERDGARDSDDGPRSGPKPFNEDWDTNLVQGNWDFIDLAQRLPGGQPLILAIDGVGITLHDHQVVFGSAQGELIEGAGEADWLYGMGGNDNLTGGTGQDHLEGNTGDDTLDGGEGNDTLLGGTGADAYTFFPGSGRDTILDADGAGSIVVDGIGTLTGAGSLRLAETVWRSADGRVRYTLDEVEQLLVITFTDRGDILTVRGWSSAKNLGIELGSAYYAPATVDTLLGDFNKLVQNDLYVRTADGLNYVADGVQANAPDLINGGADGDFIAGLGGNDGLNGRAGDDYIDAGSGNDLVFGGVGADMIRGDGGSDFLHGGTWGVTTGPGGPNTPSIAARGPVEVARGFGWVVSTDVQTQPGELLPWWWINGADTTQVADAGNVLDGGGGSDYLIGASGGDVLYGGTENDIAFGMNGDDILSGGAGNDQLAGGGSLDAGVYNYLAPGNDGADLLMGGAGNDRLFGDGGGDQLFGGVDNDELLGDFGITPSQHDSDDMLDGGAGDDEMYGGGGHDELEGGSGKDKLFGDGRPFGATGLFAGTFHGNDVLRGGAGEDQMVGGAGNDKLYGGADNDLILGDDTDLLLADHGDDWADGGEGDDWIHGGGGNDTLLGGAGKDTLVGAEGNDVLNGGSGVDVMVGGEGSDLFIADSGDLLFGEAGADRYRFTDGGFALQANNTIQVSLISDSQGQNTIEVEGTSGVAGMRMFADGGRVMLAMGNGRFVALSDQTDLTQLSVVGQPLDIGPQPAPLTIDELIRRDDAGGRAVSQRIDSAGALVSTASFNSAQTLTGGMRDERLQGGTGADALDGDAGSDLLEGGAGDDELRGGTGSDILVGGTGDDVLYAGPQSGSDTGVDLFQFQLGDGQDTIDAGTGSSGGTVLSFGAGITQADVRAFNIAAGGGDLLLAIEYGNNGDRIVFVQGTEERLLELRFDDGSSMSAGALLIQLNVVTAGPDLITGTSADDVLTGGAGDDRLLGRGGNDLLLGGAGNDTLVGGAGNNIYRFDASSGVDVIQSTVGEQATLHFTALAQGELRALLANGALTLVAAGDTTARLAGYASDPSLGAWQVMTSDGSVETLQELVTRSAAPGGSLSGAASRDSFLAQQQAQLTSLPQRFTQSAGRATPSGVTRVAQSVTADEAFEHADYLVRRAPTTITTTTTTREPIYAPVNSLGGSTGGRFVPVSQLPPNGSGGVTLPSGSVPWYDQAPSLNPADRVLRGVWLPGVQAGVSGFQNRIVGWETVTETETITVPADTALQTVLSGTAGDDTVLPGPQLNENGDGTGAEALFRGSIETGAGNDRVELTSGSNGRWPSNQPDTWDWFVNNDANGSFIFTDDYRRGLGAWVNLGDGDDFATGSDGNDVLLGGNGNDVLNGQAGADTYAVSAADTGADRIVDRAKTLTDPNDPMYLTYGGPTRSYNSDRVEFDASVRQADLRWQWATGDVLELYTGYRLLVQIEYAGWQDDPTRVGSRAGIEEFKFSDGTRLTLSELLATTAPYVPPNGQPPIVVRNPGSASVDEDDTSVVVELATVFADPEGRPLVFRATLQNGQALPTWLSVDAQTGRVSAQPGNEQVGLLGLVVTATNEAGLSSQASVELTVRNVNDAPVVGSGLLAQLDAVEAGTFEFFVAADAFADVDAGDTLTLSVSGTNGAALPNWVAFDAANRRLYGVAPVGAPQVLAVRITATDQAGAAVSWDSTLRIAAAGPQTLVGTAGNDLLQGLSGDDTLDGGAGADRMIGGLGNDRYWVDNSADQLVELPGQGTDTVVSSIDHTLGADLEALELVGSATAGTGNARDNRLLGNALDNALLGGAGNDALDGSAGNDTLRGGEGDDTYFVDSAQDTVTELTNQGIDTVVSSITRTLGAHQEHLVLAGTAAINGTGNSLSNTLTGNTAGNRLSGGAGADTMIGGAGDDIYTAENTGDTVLELAAEGQDRVQSAVSWTLGLNIEDLTLTGTAAINGGGNELANRILGNSAANVLSGGGGDDWIEGGSAADQMAGGQGSDTFVVQDAGDLVLEGLGEGTDTVRSTIDWTLSANVETLVLTGSAAINGTGNELDNTLTGNNAANQLIGGAGNDMLDGRGGDDTLDGGIGDDALIGSTGSDTYRFGRGWGADTLRDTGNPTGGADRVLFDANLARQDTTFARTGQDLRISVAGSSDSLLIQAWFQGSRNQVEQFVYADGSVITNSQVNQLISAMAQFTPSASLESETWMQATPWRNDLSLAAMV